MPEIKHNFTGGKMNKDLDERLVPNGEYRDAMNIQVSTSEESEVGTAQNILGNSLIAGQGFIPSTANCVGSIADEKNDKLYYFVVDSEELIVNGGFDGSSTGWSLNTGWSYYDGKAVAVDADIYKKVDQPNLPTGFITPGDIYEVRFTVSDYEQGVIKVNCYSENGDGFVLPTFRPENKEYIFRVQVKSGITTNSSYFSRFWVQSYDSDELFTGKIDNISVTKSVSYIVEYDTKLEVIKPVVVDTNNTVLSFHPNRLITGVNIIDDLLFWTDNYSEPKKINIHRCIKGTDKSGTIHTKLINESRDIDIDSGIDLEEKHITVIRKSPTTAPTIELISERNPAFTYSGIMRITSDPGGLVKTSPPSPNIQNASSLWFASWSGYNHLYDFSTLKIGDQFRSRIETDINGDSGFDLEWSVGDTVVFKEFSGDTYDEAPPLPITDYTIKAKILSDNNNDFSDDPAELVPNGDFALPNSSGSEPLGYSFQNNTITYDSQDSKIVFNNAGNYVKVTGTPNMDFAYGTGTQAGVYKVKIEIQGLTTGTKVQVKLISNQAGANPIYWDSPTITTNSAPGVPHEFDLTLDTNLGNTSGGFGYADGKFFIRTIGWGGAAGTTPAHSFEILNFSIERQDVGDAGMKFEVLSVNGTPATVPDGYSELRYAVDLLDEEENLFEFKFPRFACRYQYEDKEYSAFSPFTQVAFLPGSFDFHPQKGYNLGMTNGLKQIKIKDFIPSDGLFDDVVAVDILYKDEASSNIYVIDTIKNNQSGSSVWTDNEYVIKSEAVKRVLPSNQLLRPWDAVPKKALAQEISGNRIIYGNYTQGFDLLKPNTKQEYYPDFNFSIQSDAIGLNTVKSIKSLREYQLGVVFIDKYGRETPILSNSSGLDKIPKIEAAKSNKIEVSFGNTVFPENMEYFKFFVKETSGEYYNMTMDRWWDAGDGLAWLSFGSADINKIDIDTFLILKKGVESNDLVVDPARYKVLAIETEAPDYIKTKKTLIEERKHTYVANNPSNIFGNTTNDAPLFGRDKFKMRYQGFASGPGSELHNIEDGILYVEFALGGAVSKRYRITEITQPQDPITTATYNIQLDKALGDDVNFICDDPNNGLSATKIVDETVVRIYKYMPENSNEFDGRFFVKVVSDGVFIENIATTTVGVKQYRTTVSKKLYYMGNNQASLHSQALTGQNFGLYQDASGGSNYENYSGGGANDNLGFGSFASFFRNYKWARSTESLLPYQAQSGLLAEYVGQYRFDNTSTSEWKGELGSHTARSVFGYDYNVPNIRTADDSGFSDDERYGIFNDEGEQTKGNVWFIDGGPYTGNRANTEHSLHWRWMGQANGTSSGINEGANSSTINIAMGGIYNSSAGQTINYFYNIGLDNASGTGYNSQKFKDLVGKIAPSVKFRFREDPTGEIYTIKPSGITYSNKVRWSDGREYGSSPNTTISGEYPWEMTIGSSSILKPTAPVLSPNHTRGYITRFTNDRTGNGDVTWDPTNGGVTGAIPQGLRLTAQHSTSSVGQLVDVEFLIKIDDIHNITCTENGGKHSITKGMILTKYGGVILDGTFETPEGTSSSTTNSYEPLIVKDIIGGGSAPYTLSLTGYSSPIIKDANGPLAQTVNINASQLKRHIVWDTAPASGNTMVFQQPAMNGYSQYSVNRINVRNANGDGSSLDVPALMAVGYTIEFLEEIEKESEFPDNPAIWETEPKDSTDLDIYYEASGYNPFVLTEETKYSAIPIGGLISHDQNPASILEGTTVRGVFLFDGSAQSPLQITSAMAGTTDNYYILTQSPLNDFSTSPLVGGDYINIGDTLSIEKPDGSIISVTVRGWMEEGLTNTYNTNRTAKIFIQKLLHSPQTKYTLNWHNCYSFGNGVESNRIRDTYNLPFIANGVKASTTLDEHPYEETLTYGLIYSDIYNGSVGINNLNQFIAAEKITKNINPIYGSVQKLKSGWGQGGDLVTLCEDRVLKILANKDALFNADGNSNLTSTNNVLGEAIPYSGEYGISTNPESFVSEAYRAYFTDKIRGSVMRLSMDGLTPISDAGMKDFFRDNLKLENKIIGSYDDRQDEYNLTLPTSGQTVTYKEDVKGWVSFKSFIKETGVSCANGYYTFANGKLWKHHVENFSELTKVTVTGIEHVDGSAVDGKYFFFEINEMERLLGVFSGAGAVARVKQYRNNLLIKEDEVIVFGSVGNSLNPPSPSGGTTKGHGRYDLGSAVGDWEVGDIIVMGNTDRNTFYDTFTNSSLNVLLNDVPSSIKSYHTLEYEGSKSKISGLQKLTVVETTDPSEPFAASFTDFSVVESFFTNSGLTVNINDTFLANIHRNGILIESGITLTNVEPLLVPPPDFNFQVGDVITAQAQENTLDYSNSTQSDGWHVTSIKTNKKQGGLVEFIEKEGKWFNYIKGVESNIDETTDFASFDIQGLGILKQTITSDNSQQYKDDQGTNNSLTTIESFGWDWLNNVMEFDGEINTSLQIGDTIYYQQNSNAPIVKFGQVTDIHSNSIIVEETTPNPPDPTHGAFILFVKNQVINMSNLSGYYADAKFENDSKVKAELYAVSSEITQSSK